MADGTRLSISEFKIKDPKKVTDFPGCVLSPEDVELDRIVYTIGTLEERATDRGMIFYRDLPLVKTNVLTNQDVIVKPTGYFDTLYNNKEDVLKEVTKSLKPFYSLKDTANKYVLDRAGIKKDFSFCVKEAYKKNTKEEFEKNKKILEDGYIERVKEKNKELEKFKNEKRQEFYSHPNYSVGIDFLIKNLEFFCDGLVIGKNPAANFPIRDEFISGINGIISIKDDKIVYNDIGLNRTLLCVLKDEGKGLEEVPTKDEGKGLEEVPTKDEDNIIMNIGSKNPQAAYLFLGKPIQLISEEQKSIVKSKGFDRITASLKINANSYVEKKREDWSKHYICIAKGGKLSSK